MLPIPKEANTEGEECPKEPTEAVGGSNRSYKLARSPRKPRSGLEPPVGTLEGSPWHCQKLRGGRELRGCRSGSNGGQTAAVSLLELEEAEQGSGGRRRVAGGVQSGCCEARRGSGDPVGGGGGRTEPGGGWSEPEEGARVCAGGVRGLCAHGWCARGLRQVTGDLVRGRGRPGGAVEEAWWSEGGRGRRGEAGRQLELPLVVGGRSE